MAVQTYSKTGNKATIAAKLDKGIFGLEVKSHELLKQAYLAYLANKRAVSATTKTRGLISGGGKKPWRQKGTGRARVGSSRNPVWRGGGVVFGPSGEENYKINLSNSSKRLALKQALSLANDSGKVRVIETFECKNGKVKPTVTLLGKLEAKGKTLLVVSQKDELVERATRNLPDLRVTAANYLNVFDVLNADTIVFSQKSLGIISSWLGDDKAAKETKDV